MRFMMLYEPGRDSRGQPPSPEEMARMAPLIEEGIKSGELVASGGLQSSAHGARVRIDNGRHTVIDGPFAETKELVSGYAIMELPSMEAAIDAAKRFLDAMGEGVCEVRPMMESPVAAKA